VVLSIGFLASQLFRRAFQAHQVHQTIGGNLRAPEDAPDRTDRSDRHIAAMPALAAETARLDWARLLRVDLSAAACSGATVTFQCNRASRDRGLSSSTVLRATSGTGSDRFVQVEPAYTGFASVNFAHARGECLRPIGLVRDLDDPVWLSLVLAPDWSAEPLYQTLQMRENIH